MEYKTQAETSTVSSLVYLFTQKETDDNSQLIKKTKVLLWRYTTALTAYALMMAVKTMMMMTTIMMMSDGELDNLRQTN